MRPVVVDKVASVTRNCQIAREVRVSDEYPCREGDVVAVRVLTDKRTYNTVELPSGRMSLVKRGDVVVGALGHRRALMGYAGVVPSRLATGDRIQILNLGGVLGSCTGQNPDLGPPFECEVLGQVLSFPYLGERIGIPANITQGASPRGDRLEARGIPIVVVVGTCMNAGKTYACAALIQEFTRTGLRVNAFKATGVSLRRDTLSMEDAGASRTQVFTDFGVVTTSDATAPSLARSMITALSEDRPDVLVVELGDGLLGSYGVQAILADKAVRDVLTVVVLAANDPVGAWGGVLRMREEYGIETHVLTGPTTDNVAGTEVLESLLGIPARNARSQPTELARVVLDRIRPGPGAGTPA